jgi:hypothetical protein
MEARFIPITMQDVDRFYPPPQSPRQSSASLEEPRSMLVVKGKLVTEGHINVGTV